MKRGMYGENPAVEGSRPARGAWIETLCDAQSITACAVAPRAGRVD